MNLQKQNPQLEAFYEALKTGQEALEEAGRVLVSLIDDDPAVKARIMDEHPEITEDVLETFERIGRRQLYYRLCLIESPGVRCLKRCAFSDQVTYSSEPIPMLLLNGKDSTDHIVVSVQGMNADQARQVFGAHRIRTLPEQRAFLEREKSKPQPLEKSEPYSISKGKITFYQPITLTASEMARLLADMT
jgi:hypothetical protein